MNKKLIVILVTLGVIAAAVGYLALSDKSNEMPANTPTQVSTQPDHPRAPSATKDDSTVSGKYVEYKEGIIASTQGKKVLFFHAPWCPQCQDLEADIKEQGVPDGVTIIKVDYDTNQQLRQKYGVTLQTTVVLVDDDGEALKKFVAYDDPSLAAVERNLL